MKRSLRALALSTGLALTAAAGFPVRSSATYEDRAAVAAGQTQFALELFRTLADANPGRNITISPYSASLALQSLALAAGGATRTQVLRALHIEAIPLSRTLNAARSIREEIEAVEQPDIELGNQFLAPIAAQITPTVQRQMADTFGPNQRIVPYDIAADPEAARKAVNERTAGLTSRRVPEAVPSGLFGRTTRLVLVSAASLTGQWAERLVQADTMPFTNAAGRKVTVSRLTSRPNGAILGYRTGVGWRAVVIPYVGGRVSMVMIVPDAGRLAQVQRSLDREMLESIVLDSRKARVVLDAPAFGADQSVADMGGVLAKMGVTSAFLPGQADLASVTGAARPSIDVAVHYAALRFDGEETTTVKDSVLAADRLVVVDRPFLYAVVDRPTGAVLFMGRVLDPTVG